MRRWRQRQGVKALPTLSWSWVDKHETGSCVACDWVAVTQDHTMYIYIRLVVWNIVYFSTYWEQSSQLTNIFQRGGSTTNQYTIIELGWTVQVLSPAKFTRFNQFQQWSLLFCHVFPLATMAMPWLPWHPRHTAWWPGAPSGWPGLLCDQQEPQTLPAPWWRFH